MARRSPSDRLHLHGGGPRGATMGMPAGDVTHSDPSVMGITERATHIAARGDDGKIRVIEVWDSREKAEEFGQRVRAVREEVGFGVGMPPITYFDVHHLAH